MKCQNCDHMFSKNIYDSLYWDNLYESDYTGDDRKFDVTRNIMYAYEIKWIAENKKLKGKYLDVGCSYGNFFKLLPPDIKKTGLEISTEVINQAKKYHLDCEFHKKELQKFETKQLFDFIQFRGVLQHSTDPLGNLKKAKELLDSDGLIIILSLPDFSSLTSKIYRKKFTFYIPEFAPNHFTQKSFNYLIDSLNLEILQQDSPYMKTPYSNICKDLPQFITNKILNKKSPPFYGNVKNYILKMK